MHSPEKIANVSHVPNLAGKKVVVVGSKVSQAVADELHTISVNFDRTTSYIVRELLVRGLAQFYRDGEYRPTFQDESDILKAKKTKMLESAARDYVDKHYAGAEIVPRKPQRSRNKKEVTAQFHTDEVGIPQKQTKLDNESSERRDSELPRTRRSSSK